MARIEFQPQGESAECGLSVAAMLLTYFGQWTSVAELRRRFPAGNGMNARMLAGLLGECGLDCEAYQLELEELHKLRTPAVLHWRMDHVVILESVRPGLDCVIVDPAIGRQRLPWGAVSQAFTGVAFEIAPNAGFRPRRPPPSTSRGLLLAPTLRSVAGWFPRLVLLTLGIQACALTVPLFLQIVIDQVVTGGDTDLLLVLAVAFALVAGLQAGLSAFRRRLLGKVSLAAARSWARTLFSKFPLLSIPHAQARPQSELMDLARIYRKLRDIYGPRTAEGLLDSIGALAALVIIFAYSPWLTLVPLSAIAIHVLVTWAFRNRLDSAAAAARFAAGREGRFLSAYVSGLQQIRTLAADSFFQRQHAAFVDETARRRHEAEVGESRIESLDGYLRAIERIVSIGLGAYLCVQGAMTVGMLVTFLIYRDIFMRGGWQFVRALRRVSSGSGQEPALDAFLDAPEETHGRLPPDADAASLVAMRGVSLSVGGNPLFAPVDFALGKGERILLCGRSGSGKSSLLKLMVGLAEPEQGEVELFGHDLRQVDVAVARRHLGVVLQEDFLVAASVRENIAFGRPDIDDARIWHLLGLVGLAAHVQSLPMRLSTPVNDRGVNLSAGQRQRLLIARALAGGPRLLLLDEATSHLDAAAEAELFARLRELGLAMVVVSHRPIPTLGEHRRLLLGTHGLAARDSGLASTPA